MAKTQSVRDNEVSGGYLSQVMTKPQPRGSGFVVAGCPGVGKSSLAGNIPKGIAMSDDGEQTWSLLKQSGAVPESFAVLPPCKTWIDAEGQLLELAGEGHPYKCLVVDTIGGMERLCHEHVCREQFGGEWGEKGFTGYQRGYSIALPTWRDGFIARLDAIRSRGISVMLLCHTKITHFSNPEGADYDQYVPDLHEKTWKIVEKWADAVLFANFFSVTDKDKADRKAKAKGGQERILYTQNHPAYTAKNRFGFPPEIPMGDSGKEAWENLKAAIVASTAKKEK